MRVTVRWSVPMLAVAVATVGFAQQSQGPSLDTLLTPSQQSSIGLERLTPAERENLRQLLLSYFWKGFEAGRATIVKAPQPQPAAGGPTAAPPVAPPAPQAARAPAPSPQPPSAPAPAAAPLPQPAPAPPGAPSPAPAPTPAKPDTGGVYKAAGANHWIHDNGRNGALIKLEDGSLWKIEPKYRAGASFWLTMANISAFDSAECPDAYPYMLVNEDINERACAQYLPQH
jgi:outer membrane biosynthesis protein TonB